MQLCVLPTASGKGVMLAELMERASKVGARSLLLLNREKLVSQFINRLEHLNPSVYSASADRKETNGHITIASIQSCYRVKFEDIKLIILDEAHNIGVDGGMYDQFLSQHNAKIIGFTATPYNDRGYIYGKDKPFPKIDFIKPMVEMIEDGWIVKPRSICPPSKLDISKLRVRAGEYVTEDIEDLLTDKKVKEQVTDAIGRMGNRNKIVWACTSIKHAEQVREEIIKFEDAAILHSKQNDFQKELNTKAFEEGTHRHMVTVMMLSEGYDYAPIDCVVLMRPTKSARLYVQICGRALRLHPDKKDALILDYGSVIENLGSLANPVISEGKAGKAPPMQVDIKLCPQCFETAAREVKECDCGYVWPIQVRDLTKALKKQASQVDILNEPPKVYKVTEVEFKKHKAKSGNTCIRINYYIGLTCVSEYFSNHPYSWSKGRDRMKYLTGFGFDSFEECFNNCESLTCEHLVEVETVRDGQWNKIKRVTTRTRDSDIPF
jgi:DNA repair protein RadD